MAERLNPEEAATTDDVQTFVKKFDPRVVEFLSEDLPDPSCWVDYYLGE